MIDCLSIINNLKQIRNAHLDHGQNFSRQIKGQ